MIKVPQTWKTTTGSKDVKIAVVDSGIDARHKDLKKMSTRVKVKISPLTTQPTRWTAWDTAPT
ncbi:hypothetical protein ACR6HW_04125 [Fusibacter sp. JL298sf-3]